MDLLNKNSLVQTIDNISEAMLMNKEIPLKDKTLLANFILSRQDKPLAYAHTFAPTEFDLAHEFRLFTGEKVNSKVGLCHILGEEASSILRKLNSKKGNIDIALQKADNGLDSYINKYSHLYPKGFYCCKTCSSALWLNIGTGGVKSQQSLLTHGIKILENQRNGNGRWKGFHYYYTLHVLNAIDIEFAKHELKYAAPEIEKRLKLNLKNESKYELRRNLISEQILQKIN